MTNFEKREKYKQFLIRKADQTCMYCAGLGQSEYDLGTDDPNEIHICLCVINRLMNEEF